ncbi:MAG: ATP-binding protein [Bacteroidota bacterium]
MIQEFKDLRAYIEGLEMKESHREQMHFLSQKLEKALAKQAFSLKRTLKDKSIVVNLLNKSLEDLQENKEEIERVNNHLTSNLKELQRSYKEMEQFAYIASHDLKSPLRTISNFAQILQRRYKNELDNEAHEFIEYIVSGVFRMNSIIGDLLEYSKVGNKESTFEMTDLNEILELVQFNLASTIRDNMAVIVVQGLPQLRVNRSALMQLFQNLIGNAVKFKDKSRKPIIRVSADPMEKGWMIHVADNGVGMDDGYQEKAFLPFQRINNLDRPGTGIGLAICKKAVEIHHGKITYDTVKGQGTTFHFSLFPTEEYASSPVPFTTSAHI